MPEYLVESTAFLISVVFFHDSSWEECFSRSYEWFQCTASCEEDGIKYRILQCVWYGTKKPAGNACRDIPRPPVMKTCKGQPCQRTSGKRSSLVRKINDLIFFLEKKNKMTNKCNDRELKFLTTVSEECRDHSQLCSKVKMMNMCRVPLYQKQCCDSCR